MTESGRDRREGIGGGAQEAGAEGEELDGSKRSGSAFRKRLWALGGFLSFGLGAVGAVFPIIPTTPFLLVAAFCFARSSERIDRWFHGTKLYHEVLEGYATRRTMTVKAKLSILVPVTALMLVAFILMRKVPVGQAVLACVWVAHLVYFGLVVKTDRGEDDAEAAAGAPEEGAAARAQEPLIIDMEPSGVAEPKGLEARAAEE